MTRLMVQNLLLMLACIGGGMSAVLYHDLGGVVGCAIGFGYSATGVFNAAQKSADKR